MKILKDLFYVQSYSKKCKKKVYSCFVCLFVRTDILCCSESSLISLMRFRRSTISFMGNAQTDETSVPETLTKLFIWSGKVRMLNEFSRIINRPANIIKTAN